MNIDQQYLKLIADIMTHGGEEFNARTQAKCKTISGAMLQVDVAKEFPLLSLRPIPIKMFVSEIIFYLMGTKNPTWLRQFTQIWDKFLDNKGEISTSYGYRWRTAFGRDQIQELIDVLKKDPTSRHGVVMMWDPRSDGLMGIPQPNVPCPIMFTAQIIGSRLHMTVTMRSQDVYLGLPSDVAGFALLNLILSQELGVMPGVYTHFIANAHIYENQYGHVELLLGRVSKQQPLTFGVPLKSFKRAREGDIGLVTEIIERIQAAYTPLDKLPPLDIMV